MRLVNRYRGSSVTAIHNVSPEEAYATGGKARKGIIAHFQHAGRGLSEWEIAEASKVFEFRGLAFGEEGRDRLSFYDTELEQLQHGWSDELREEVEAALLGHPNYGLDFIQVEKPKLPAPWPAYDSLKGSGVGKRIASTVDTTGLEPEAVLAYERENGNRKEVVEALEALIAPEPAEETVAA